MIVLHVCVCVAGTGRGRVCRLQARSHPHDAPNSSHVSACLSSPSLFRDVSYLIRCALSVPFRAAPSFFTHAHAHTHTHKKKKNKKKIYIYIYCTPAKESSMLPIQRSSHPSLTLLPVRPRWRCLVHPVRAVFAQTTVLRQGNTLLTRPPGTVNGGVGSNGDHGSDGRAPAPARSGDGAAAPLPAAPHVRSELCFYDTFVLSEVDLHLALLQEAHYKHGVWLNVPPQLAPSAPNVGPPAVPEPIYPSAQRERLEAMAAALKKAQNKCSGGARVGSTKDAELIVEPSCLAYRPTHDPPPFSTTGTRSLCVLEQRPVSAGAATPTAKGAVSGVRPPAPSSLIASAAELSRAENASATPTTHTAVQTVAIRRPVDASMLYHCSACSRPFRRREAAEQHVHQRHEQSSHGGSANGAAVMEGPGPGEIIGYEDKAVSVTTTTTTTTAAAARAASPSSVKAATQGRGLETNSEVATAKGVADTSTVVKASSLNSTANYYATPRVDLPEVALIDKLLADVWDAVALARDDIEKPADLSTTRADLQHHLKGRHDSCQGRLFVPSVLVVEGVADNRADVEAAAQRSSVRATPDGAAPGIKRRPASMSLVPSLSTFAPRLLPTQRRNADGTLGVGSADTTTTTGGGGGIGGGALGAAPTAQELSIAELSRHYPNPFGDSPNAALVESEKEPINPFVDLEGQAAAVAAAAPDGAAAADSPADDAASSPDTEGRQWLSRWATRAYACPLCQRRALPDFMKIMAPLLPPSLMAISKATSPAPPTADAYGDGRRASPRPGPGTTQAPSTASGATPTSTAGVSSLGPAQSVPPSGSLEEEPLVVDVEAWSWYAERVPRFRLLDSLEDHLQLMHTGDCCDGDEAAAALGGDEDDSLSEADWQFLYCIARHRQLLARVELLAVQKAYRIMYPKLHGTSAEGSGLTTSDHADAPNHAGGETGKDGAESAAIHETSGTFGASAGGSPASTSDSGATTADDVNAPQVHVRSAVNMIMIGTVRDVQEGFLGPSRILQYVVAVRNTFADSSGPTPADAVGSHVYTSNGEEGDADGDEDLIVVRCVGDLAPVALLKQQARLGSTVFVAGSLRMNRNVDTVSRRSHAYPYVQVVPPLGCVRVLEA
ncbi:RNA-editing complex protein MP81, putative [Leishmania tarentolae]|uniref:RNA-editing complex protein MP81, putative n=1 Tax=Leishmania tarentolae TaxID=5689 RepID=A0A640K900_LEITA|nr:RNA-editing complex protein MP81, putative [Leishmania tarentolae]